MSFKLSLLSPIQILPLFKRKAGDLHSMILQFFIRNAGMKIWPVSSATICNFYLLYKVCSYAPNHPNISQLVTLATDLQLSLSNPATINWLA